MTTKEPFGQVGRFVVAGMLLATLFGLMVWSGAVPANPLEREVPNEVEVTPNREAHVGEQVVLGGRIVDTDPVTLATRASGYGRFTLVDIDGQVRNTDEPLEVGDHVSAYGTLEDEETLVVTHAMVQPPSEVRYMFAVSLLGGLWVAGRVLRQWRFDTGRLAFVPRDRSPSSSTESSEDDRDQIRSRGGDRRA